MNNELAVSNTDTLNNQLQEIEVKPIDLLKKQAESAVYFRGFTVEKIHRFIDNCLRYWPATTKICFSSGIDPRTWFNHKRDHPEFAELVKTIEMLVTDDIELIMKNEATNPKSFLDRIAYLKAHRPELYNPAKVVRIEGYKMTDDERVRRAGVVESFIDADISESYRNRNTKQIGGPETKESDSGAVAGESSGGSDAIPNDSKPEGDSVAEKNQP